MWNATERDAATRVAPSRSLASSSSLASLDASRHGLASMDGSRHSAAGGSGGDVAALSASLGLTGVGDASAAARPAGPRRRRPAAGDCSDGDSSAGSLDGSLHGLLDGSLHGLRRARDGSLHGLLDGSLRGLRGGGGGGDDAARHSPLSLPRHALATGESLDASDHFRGDAMARALPETSLRRARECDDSSHRSAGSRHSYRGDLDDSLAWRARCARKPAVPR